MLSHCATQPQQQPAILQNLFPPQQQQMVANNPAPPQGGNQGTPLQGGSTLNANIYMCNQDINVKTRACNYDAPETGQSNKESFPSQPNGHL